MVPLKALRKTVHGGLEVILCWVHAANKEEKGSGRDPGSSRTVHGQEEKQRPGCRAGRMYVDKSARKGRGEQGIHRSRKQEGNGKQGSKVVGRLVDNACLRSLNLLHLGRVWFEMAFAEMSPVFFTLAFFKYGTTLWLD